MGKENKEDKFDSKSTPYISKNLKAFTSFDQAAEAEYTYVANQNPIDRLKETVELILRVFPIDKKRSTTNKIYFDKLRLFSSKVIRSC